MKISQSLFFEQWRDIPGFWGEFQISNRGRIKRLAYQKHHRYEKPLNMPERILFSPKINRYHNPNLNGKHIGAHRLMWFSFKGQIPEGLVINHKNGIKCDNVIENLEVVTTKENLRHSHYILKHTPPFRGKYGKDNWKSRLVGQYDNEGNLIATFNGTNEAMRLTGIDASSISRVCRGDKAYPRTGGFYWKYLSNKHYAKA